MCCACCSSAHLCWPAPSGNGSDDELQVEYATFLRRHLVAGIRWDGFRLSTNSVFSPGKCVISQTLESNDTAVVEVRKPMGRRTDGEHAHDCEVARMHERWVITALYDYLDDGVRERLRML